MKCSAWAWPRLLRKRSESKHGVHASHPDLMSNAVLLSGIFLSFVFLL